jgi:hypothetical protein
LWNATRGHRLTPWRSEYLRWRVETYSGMRAETLTFGKILSFVWTSRWELLSYLAWTGRLEREARKRGWDQGSGIRDQGSGIRDQGSGIRDQMK